MDRHVYRVWPQGQASASNTAPVLMLLRWTEQTCDSPVSCQSCQILVTAMGLDTDPTDGPGPGGLRLCHPASLWQFCAYLANLQAGSSDQMREPTPLITRAGMEMLGRGHQRTSIRHDLPGGDPANSIYFASTCVLPDLSPWVANELCVPVRSNRPL